MADERWKECKHHYDGCACREHAWAEQVERLTFELDVEKSNCECLKVEWNRAVALAQEHCPKPVLGQAWLTDGIPLLAERAKRAEAEVARLKGETYCAYCGERFPLDAPDSCEQIGNHIQVCPKHPMRAVEAQRDAAFAEVDRIKAERKEPFRSACCVSCGAKLELDAAFERLKRETSRAYPDSVAQIVEGIKVYPQPTNGEAASEREALEQRVRLAVNEWCSCGGRGPDDDEACSACHVLHMVFEGEVS